MPPFTNPKIFGGLLYNAVRRVSKVQDNFIKNVQTELGKTIGRNVNNPRSCIEFWEKGHVPANLDDLEKLGRELVDRGGFETLQELQEFINSAGYSNLTRVYNELTQRFHYKFSAEDFAPFIVGSPIAHPRQFFGRKSELKRIFGLWRQYPLQHLAVIGQKLSGKSSLLHYLKEINTVVPQQLRPEQRTDWLPHPERYQWVYIDFQYSPMKKLERLLRFILDALRFPEPATCDLDNVMEVINNNIDRPTIFLMDDIGAGLSSPELDMEFWWSLRSLGTTQSDKLGFIATSNEAPMLLSYKYGKPSPFFNIFGCLNLGPLTEAEAYELISSSPQPFDTIDIEWIMAQSKCWPFLVQMLCQIRLNSLQNNEIDTKWKEEGLEQISPYQ